MAQHFHPKLYLMKFLCLDSINNFFFTQVISLMAARTLFFDNQLTDAIKNRKIEQLILFGAGFDARALRFRDLITENNVKVFELDLEITQEQKKKLISSTPELNSILPHDNITFISTDFNQSSLKNDLLKNFKFNPNKKSLLFIEGVSPYISLQSFVNTLNFIHENSAKGSRVVFDVMNFKNDSRLLFKVFYLLARYLRENVVEGITTENVERVSEQTGFKLVQRFTFEDMENSLKK